MPNPTPSAHAPRDARGRRIALVCHCLLNANAKVEGLSVYAGVHPLINRLAEQGVGVIQMPCAELGACGMRRWGQTREQYDFPAFRELCARLAEDTRQQVTEFQRCGYEVLGVVGVDGSPTCGVTRSASGDWGGEHAPEVWAEVVSHSSVAAEPGLHISALMTLLEPLGVRFTAIDESIPGHRTDEVVATLTGGE